MFVPNLLFAACRTCLLSGKQDLVSSISDGVELVYRNVAHTYDSQQITINY